MNGHVQWWWPVAKTMLAAATVLGLNCGWSVPRGSVPFGMLDVSIREAESARTESVPFASKLTAELQAFVESNGARSLKALSHGTTASVHVSESDSSVELMVGYEDSVEEATRRIEQCGYQVLDHIPGGRLLVVVSKSGEIRANDLRGMIAEQCVRYVALNHVIGLPDFDFNIQSAPDEADVATSGTPNDPMFGEMWGHRAVHAQSVWHKSRETNVIVAVIDTGVDLTHPDLGGANGNLWTNAAEADGVAGRDDDGNGIIDDVHGAAFQGRRRDGRPQDDNGHGTHCAGTIGAIGNNGRGVIGLNWKVSIMVVKVLGANGSGSNSDVVRGIYYAIENGAQVICNSYGGDSYDPYMREAIEAAQRQGVLFVAAAGNKGANTDAKREYPAGYGVSNILSVGAMDREDCLASFSNYGRQSVHIAAPGVNILSTYPVSMGSYKFMSGTSMATPYVAGAAALIWNHVDASDRPRWQAVREALISNGRHLEGLKNKVRGGTVFDLAAMASDSDLETPSPSAPIPSAPLPVSPIKPKPAPSNGGSDRYVYQQKVFKDHVLRGKGNLLSVELDLKQSSIVRITGHASVHSGNGNVVQVGTGYSYNERLTGDFWKESWRGLTVPAGGHTVVLSSDFITELAAGKHKIYWRVFTGNESDELNFSEAASLIVEVDQRGRAPITHVPVARVTPVEIPTVESPARPAPDAGSPPMEERIIRVPSNRMPPVKKPSGVKAPTKKGPISEEPVEEVSSKALAG